MPFASLLLFKMIFYFLPGYDYDQSPCEDYIRCVYLRCLLSAVPSPLPGDSD